MGGPLLIDTTPPPPPPKKKKEKKKKKKTKQKKIDREIERLREREIKYVIDWDRSLTNHASG